MGKRGFVALGHPVAVLSLVGLVINDHLLKAEFGNWFTGKLSDVFGLVVFPLLLASVFERVLARWCSRPMHWAALATAVGFCLIKTVSSAAVFVARGLSVVTPSRIVADATDLLALPAIGIAWLLWLRVDPEDHRGWRLPVGRLLLAAGIMASLATSSDGGYSQTFTGSFVLTAEDRSAEILIETFIEGERVPSASRVEPRWVASFLGSLNRSPIDEAIVVNVTDNSDGPDSITFTLDDERAGPAEVHWSIVAQGNEGSPGIFGGDATEVATLILEEVPESEVFSVDVLALQPLNQNREIKVNEWSIVVDSNNAELSLVSLSTAAGRDLRAATGEQILDIAPGGSVNVPIPSSCPSTGCAFSLFTVMVGEGTWRNYGPSDLRLISVGDSGTSSASVEQRALKRRNVNLDVGDGDARGEAVTYALDIEVPAPTTAIEEITTFLRVRTRYSLGEESSEQSRSTGTTVWEYHPAFGTVRAEVVVPRWNEEPFLELRANAQYLTLKSSDPESLQVTVAE